VIALAALLLAGAGQDSWRPIEPPLDVAFPRDHAAHLDVRTEWWYVTGELEDAGGARFGWQITIFRQGLDPSAVEPRSSALRARHALAAHVALVDVATGRLRHVERLRRLGDGLAWASVADLDVGLEDASIRRDPEGTLVARGGALEAGFALDLTLEPAKAPVMHGAEGVSQKGPERGNASAYCSFTRLRARGRLTLDGVGRDVRGEAWFDHEWGTSQLGAGVVGWDWTGLRLDDGRELMVYRLRLADGSASPFSAGTIVAADGTTRHLRAGDFLLAPAGTWRSPATQAEYPVRWRLSVPSAGIEGELAARTPACEIDGRASTGAIYWEGPARLGGTSPGSGYLEMSGYATSMAARF
jgi:predicted secreted hydrolase